MNLILYGAGKEGKHANDIINNFYKEKYNVEMFIDSNKEGSYCDKKIINLKDIESINKNSIIVITIDDLYAAADICFLLRAKGFEKIYYFLELNVNHTENSDFLKDECMDTSQWDECVLPHMELHIVDKCNLKCKGCTHFSPLFDNEELQFDDIIQDVLKVSKIFSTIIRLDILGGEPFLNQDITKYITEIRKILPTASIDIFTNGLLIPTLADKVFDCIRENNLFISVTEYKPTHVMIDKIISRLTQHNIKYKIMPYDKRQMFNKPLSISENSKYPNLCISNGCATVANGMIARCPTLMYINKFNEVFNTKLPNQGIMKLDDWSLGSGIELLKKLKEEVPLCKHCIQCDMKWEVCEKEIKLEDFAVRD